MSVSRDGQGYGSFTKILHWVMFLALAAQFVVGYAMDRADDLFEWAVDRWLGGEDDLLLIPHVALGVFILLLAVIRVIWRKTTALPPWAEGLTAMERRVAHRVEQVLYWTMFLIPITGLALVLLTGEDWDLGEREWQAPREWVDDDVVLGSHIATHLVFFGAFFTHIGLVFNHQFIHRDGLLRRML